MATGTVLLPPNAAVLSDGASSNAAPGMTRRKGTDTSPAKTFLTLDFDPGTDEHCHFAFRMPTDYASGGTLQVQGMVNATTGSVIMGATVSATTAGDTDTPLEHAKSSAATVTIAANGTEARRLITGSITLNMDSAAAGDFVVITLYRDADNGSDDCSVDFELVAAAFEYTTT